MGTRKVEPKEYVAIRVWHESSGSKPYYWEDLQERAVYDRAPLNAIFRADGGQWVTTDDLAPDHNFHAILKRFKEKGTF